MNAPAENTAPCALVLGTLFLEKPSSSTAKLLLEGLASADLPAEWPYGDKAALEEIGEQLQCTVGADPADLDRDYHRLFVGPGKLARAPVGVGLPRLGVGAVRRFVRRPAALDARPRHPAARRGKSRARRPHWAHARASQLAFRQPAGPGRPFSGRALDDLGTALFRTAWASGRRHPGTSRWGASPCSLWRPSPSRGNPSPSPFQGRPTLPFVGRPSLSHVKLVHAVSFALRQP